MALIKKVLRIFSQRDKTKLVFLLAAIIIGALLEMAALTVVYPFISILLDSAAIENSEVLSLVYDTLSFGSNGAFLAFLAFLLAFIYIFRSVYLFVVAKVQFRFLTNRQVELAERLLSALLDKPYLYHASKNLADFQRIVLADSNLFIQLVLNVLMFLTDFFMCFFIVIFLIIQSPSMTLTVMGLALVCLLLYFKVFRDKVKAAGEENRIKNVAMSKAANQAFGSIKEMKMFRREKFFTGQFKLKGDDYAYTNQRFQVYGAIPRLLIEAVCFGGAFVLIGILIALGNNMENTVPLLSLFVLAAFRLLPAMARFAGSINMIIFYKPSVDNVYCSLFEDDGFDNDFNDAIQAGAAADRHDAGCAASASRDTFQDIIVENISFQYPNTNTAVFEDISLCIPHKKSTAFIGPTGGGKTTLVDIILGIYPPGSGRVLYEGKYIHHNFDEWATKIGYIPQQIYLLDETITENVAFGVPKDEVDIARVWESLGQAQLTEFVRSLPDGLDTIAGDRGVRLSGGQRQRIGIARALYINPSILVLDEATSSLDNDTEKAVMEAIDRFQGEKTMIIVAHRLSTIENCDVIYRVEGGRVIKEKG